MERRALIITNPGESDAENYCHGVNQDRAAYRSFLESAIGGGWYSHEIETLDRPGVADVLIAVQGLKKVDYSIVIFSGHACHSTSRDDTLLELRAGKEIESSHLRVEGQRQTLILDCCRIPTTEDLRESLMFKAARALPAVSGPKCRAAYERAILICDRGTTVMYACSVGESAYDSPQGGAYSYSLLRGANEWAEYVDCDTRFQSKTFSVAAAHDSAAEHIRKRRQTQAPVIEKPRSGPYLPFAVVA